MRSTEGIDGNSGVSRRVFVRTSLGVALLAPALAGAAGDDPAPLITGTGAQKFRVEHDWLRPPADLVWGDTHGLAQDARGNIYVAHTVHPTSTRKHAIAVFDADGKFVNSWGEQFVGGGHGLDIRKEAGDEFLYHCDVNRRMIAKTKLDGTVVWEFGAPLQAKFRDQSCYGNAGEWNPTNVAFAPDGDLFVGDGYGKSFVHRFSKDGEWKSTLAGPGSAAGEVKCPHGLWIDSRGPLAQSGEPLLAVADRGNRRIQYFSLEGKHLGFVTDGMRQPCHFKTRDDLLLVPDLSSVVTILDRDNKVVTHLCDGDPTTLRDAPRDKFIPGRFVHPHTAMWLADGSILVAEWVPIGRITRLVRV